MLTNGLDGVGRTGRQETAARRPNQRCPPVQTQNTQQHPCQRSPARGGCPRVRVVTRFHAHVEDPSVSRSSRAASSRRTSLSVLSAHAARATSTTSVPNGSEMARDASRSRRFARLRATAPPTRFDAITARRAGRSSARRRRWTTRRCPEMRDRLRSVAAISRPSLRRWASTSIIGAIRLGRQLAAAAAPAGSDDATTGSRTHARTKTVLARTATVVRLKCALHVGSPLRTAGSGSCVPPGNRAHGATGDNQVTEYVGGVVGRPREDRTSAPERARILPCAPTAGQTSRPALPSTPALA